MELKTEIIINSSPEKIWKILTEFEKYPEWNPFILSLKGDVKKGNRIEVLLQQPSSKPMKFKPKVLEFSANKEFRWKGKLLFKGLFDGEHIFIIEKLSENSCRFVQKENFTGILVPLLKKQLNTKTKAGFEKMNQKLKERAEA